VAWTNIDREKTALLVDGSNCYEACKMLRSHVDFAKVLKVFKPRQAYYFTALPENDRNDPNNIFKMVDYISYNGYTLVSKPTKEYINDGVLTTKGNMDVEIALYIVKSASWADHIILMSGDGDFRMAVEEAQRQGVRVTVISTLKTNPPMVSDDLRRQANVFLDMSDPTWKENMEWKR
jgi:uncharacterized LabA/DUF88 family protein